MSKSKNKGNKPDQNNKQSSEVTKVKVDKEVEEKVSEETAEESVEGTADEVAGEVADEVVGVEVAFLQLQLVGKVDVAASEAVTKTEGDAVDGSPVSVVGFGEVAVVVDVCIGCLLDAGGHEVIAKTDCPFGSWLQFCTNFYCVLSAQVCLYVVVAARHVQIAAVAGAVFVGCQVLEFIFYTKCQHVADSMSDAEVEFPRGAETVLVVA